MDTMTTVATKHGLSIADIRGRSQRRPVRLARAEVVVGLHAKGLSLRAIGRIVDRDHTAVKGVLRRQRDRSATE